MRSPNYFVVKPYNDQTYNSTKDIAGVDVVMSSSIEDHLYVNRYAVIQSTPDWYEGDMRKYDIAIVHHNVFRVYYDMQGNKVNSWNYFKDNIYLLDQSQIYMFKHGEDGEWITEDPYCFVSPIDKMDDKTVLRTGIYEDNFGTVEYAPKGSEFKRGDKVYFGRDMEYEFEIDGRKMYRMRTSDICLKI